MFDKDEQEISQIIEEGIDQLLSGQATLEQILAQHPAEADTIRPELETAVWLFARKEEVGPRPGFVSASRKRVVERVKQEASGQNAKHGIFGFIWPQRLAYQWVAAVLIVVLFLSGTSGLVSASQGALPGDNLYSVKLFTEQVSYNITVSPASRVQLSAQLAERRLDEISALLTRGNFDAVQPALREFEWQVNRTVGLLQGMDTDPNQNQNQAEKDLAVAVQSKLTRNAERLEDMQAAAPAGAPAAVLTKLKEAHDITALGATVAGDVSNGKPADARFTDTPTLPATETASPAPQATPVPAATNTAAAGKDTTDTGNGAGTGTDLAAEPTPDPGNTISPTDSTNPNKNPKSVKSPKPNPANSNPANPNPSNPNSGKPNPGKPEDKPPKDNSSSDNSSKDTGKNK